MAADAQQLRSGYGAALWAVSGRIRELRLEIERELGGLSRVVDNVLGPVLLWSARREARRFPRGRPLEPRTWVVRRAGSS